MHVVAPNKTVAVLGLELAVDVLLRLLHGDVHVAVEAGAHALVRDAAVELDDDGPAQDGLEEVAGLVF